MALGGVGRLEPVAPDPRRRRADELHPAAGCRALPRAPPRPRPSSALEVLEGLAQDVVDTGANALLGVASHLRGAAGLGQPPKAPPPRKPVRHELGWPSSTPVSRCGSQASATTRRRNAGSPAGHCFLLRRPGPRTVAAARLSAEPLPAPGEAPRHHRRVLRVLDLRRQPAWTTGPSRSDTCEGISRPAASHPPWPRTRSASTRTGIQGADSSTAPTQSSFAPSPPAAPTCSPTRRRRSTRCRRDPGRGAGGDRLLRVPSARATGHLSLGLRRRQSATQGPRYGAPGARELDERFHMQSSARTSLIRGIPPDRLTYQACSSPPGSGTCTGSATPSSHPLGRKGSTACRARSASSTDSRRPGVARRSRPGARCVLQPAQGSLDRRARHALPRAPRTRRERPRGGVAPPRSRPRLPRRPRRRGAARIRERMNVRRVVDIKLAAMDLAPIQV